MLNGGAEARGRTEDSHRGEVVERQLAGVDTAGLRGNADIDHPAGRLDQRQSGGGNGPIAGAVDDRVVAARRRIVRRPVLADAEPRREFGVARVKRQDVDFRARGAREGGGEQSYGPRSPDEDLLAWSGLCRRCGAPCVTARLDQRARPVVDCLG